MLKNPRPRKLRLRSEKGVIEKQFKDKTDKPYAPVSMEVLRALQHPSFNVVHVKLALHVIEHTWGDRRGLGPGEWGPPAYHFDRAEALARFGVDPGNLSKYYYALLLAGVLFESEEGLVGVENQTELWNLDLLASKPRATQSEFVRGTKKIVPITRNIVATTTDKHPEPAPQAEVEAPYRKSKNHDSNESWGEPLRMQEQVSAELIPPTTPKKTTKPKEPDPRDAEAKALTDQLWLIYKESRGCEPDAKYFAIKAMVLKLLKSGYTGDQMVSCLKHLTMVDKWHKDRNNFWSIYKLRDRLAWYVANLYKAPAPKREEWDSNKWLDEISRQQKEGKQ